MIKDDWTAIFWCEFIEFSVFFNLWCNSLGV